jgi:hypothetical protein
MARVGPRRLKEAWTGQAPSRLIAGEFSIVTVGCFHDLVFEDEAAFTSFNWLLGIVRSTSRWPGCDHHALQRRRLHVYKTAKVCHLLQRHLLPTHSDHFQQGCTAFVIPKVTTFRSDVCCKT